MWDSARQRVGDFAADWAIPICMALATGVAVWLVWHFTKPECTATAAANGLCNPGVIARYITVEILLQFGGAALAVGALKGGYDRYMMRRMINEEREARQATEQHLAEQIAEQRKRVDETIQQANEARQQAEQQLAAERKRVDENIRQANEARDSALQMVAELVNEFREERRENAAVQQALLDTIARLNEQRNGQREDPPEN